MQIHGEVNRGSGVLKAALWDAEITTSATID
jgi:hypothetical protein